MANIILYWSLARERKFDILYMKFDTLLTSWGNFTKNVSVFNTEVLPKLCRIANETFFKTVHKLELWSGMLSSGIEYILF
jgi:hypothetical protein